jgi:hypothetical protein
VSIYKIVNVYHCISGTKYNQLSYEVSTTVNTKVSKAFAAGGRVIEYFHDAFFALWINGSIRDDFVALHKRHSSYKLWVVEKM